MQAGLAAMWYCMAILLLLETMVQNEQSCRSFRRHYHSHVEIVLLPQDAFSEVLRTLKKNINQSESRRNL